MNNNNIVQLTAENFQQVIIDDSKDSLILVVFWAEQVPESVQLKQQLVTKAQTHLGDFILATVDCQAQQQVAMQFGIQGLPTAIFVKDSQPIDGIAGPQTPAQVEEFLAKNLPKPEDKLLEEAQQLLADKKTNDAYTLAIQAYQLDQNRADIKLVLADICVQLGKVADAEQLLSTVMLVDQDSYYAAIKAKIELAKDAADSPEIQALETELATKPDDVSIKHHLAAQYVQANRHEDALNLLFTHLQVNRGDNDTKQRLLDVLKALPNGDPLASQFRRKLYTLMY